MRVHRVVASSPRALQSVRTARLSALQLALLAALATGCGSETVSVPSAPTPSTRPTPTPTVLVSFEIKPTPVRVHQHRRPRALPSPTPFHPGLQPYLMVFPSSGPPVSRTIYVRGGNLPKWQTIQLTWSPSGRASPLSTVSYTDKQGGLSTHFSIPGSPPGRYLVRAEIDGVTYAAAWYAVTSAARLNVSVLAEAGGDSIQVSGKRFLPELDLLLVAFPVFRRGHVILGWARTNARGAFSLQSVPHRLEPGQYVLRAYSTSALSAQMAEALFEVVI